MRRAWVAMLLAAACIDFDGLVNECMKDGRCADAGGLGGGAANGGGSATAGGTANGGGVSAGGGGAMGGGSSTGGGTSIFTGGGSAQGGGSGTCGHAGMAAPVGGASSTLYAGGRVGTLYSIPSGLTQYTACTNCDTTPSWTPGQALQPAATSSVAALRPALAYDPLTGVLSALSREAATEPSATGPFYAECDAGSLSDCAGWTGTYLGIAGASGPTLAMVSGAGRRSVVWTGVDAGLVYAECSSACLASGSWSTVGLGFGAEGASLHVRPDGGRSLAAGGTAIRYGECGAQCDTPGGWTFATLAGGTNPALLTDSIGVQRLLATSSSGVELSTCASNCTQATSWSNRLVVVASAFDLVSTGVSSAGKTFMLTSDGSGALVFGMENVSSYHLTTLSSCDAGMLLGRSPGVAPPLSGFQQLYVTYIAPDGSLGFVIWPIPP